MSEFFKKKLLYLYGCFGFISLFSLKFFSSKDITDLYALSCIGFFSYFFIASIYTNTPDERYYKNRSISKSFTCNMAIFELAISLILIALFPISLDYYPIIIFSILDSCVLMYSIKFYILEKK